MNAEIVRAGALRPEDIIAYGKHILLVGEVDIDSAPGVAWVQIEGHVNKVAFNFDDWVPKILPEPLEVREGWWFSEVFIDYGQETQGQWRVFSTYEEAKKYAIEHNAPCDGKRIEHVRETVLSRESITGESR